MQGQDDYKKLLGISLKLLSIRPRSVQEILHRLQKYSSDSDLLNRVIDQLKSDKFLDDEKFAQWLIESRSRSRPRGNRLLIQELKSKGIDEMTINAHRMTTNDEILLARQALSKKQKSWSGLATRDYRLKAIRYLQSRGFNWSVIEKVLKNGYNDDYVS